MGNYIIKYMHHWKKFDSFSKFTAEIAEICKSHKITHAHYNYLDNYVKFKNREQRDIVLSELRG